MHRIPSSLRITRVFRNSINSSKTKTFSPFLSQKQNKLVFSSFSTMSLTSVQVAPGRKIVVERVFKDSFSGPCVVYVPGFMSKRESQKGNALLRHCSERGYEYIRYDPEGLGDSAFDSRDQWDHVEFEHWMQDCESAIASTSNRRLILVGSSMGGWISLKMAERFRDRIIGMILIAPAMGYFSKAYSSVIETFDEETQKKIESGKTHYFQGEFCEVFVRKGFVENSKKFELPLDKEDSITIGCPVRILHGMQDDTVPYELSLTLIKALRDSNVELTLVKNGDHRLSQHVHVILETLDSMISNST